MQRRIAQLWDKLKDKLFLTENLRRQEFEEIKEQTYAPANMVYDIIVFVYLILAGWDEMFDPNVLIIHKVVMFVYFLKIISHKVTTKMNTVSEVFIFMALSLSLAILALLRRITLRGTSLYPADILYFTLAKALTSISRTQKFSAVIFGFLCLIAYQVFGFYLLNATDTMSNSSNDSDRPNHPRLLLTDDEACTKLLANYKFGKRYTIVSVWVYLLGALIVLLYKLEICKEEYRKAIQKKIDEPEVWKRFLLERTSQPLIGTGSFEMNNASKVTTFNSFNIKNHYQLVWLLKNMEVANLNSDLEEIKQNEEAEEYDFEEKKKGPVKLVEFISKDERRSSSNYDNPSNVSKIYAKLGISNPNELRTAPLASLAPKVLDKELYFEVFYTSYQEIGSKTVNHLLSFNEISDKLKYRRSLKTIDTYSKLYSMATANFTETLQQAEYELKNFETNNSINVSNKTPSDKASIKGGRLSKLQKLLLFMKYLNEEVKLGVTLVEDPDKDVVNLDSAVAFNISEVFEEVIGSFEHLVEARGTSVTVEKISRFEGDLFQDRKIVSQIIFSVLLETILASDYSTITVGFKNFYQNTIEIVVRVGRGRKIAKGGLAERLCREAGPFSQVHGYSDGLAVYVYHDIRNRVRLTNALLKSVILLDEDKRNKMLLNQIPTPTPETPPPMILQQTGSFTEEMTRVKAIPILIEADSPFQTITSRFFDLHCFTQVKLFTSELNNIIYPLPELIVVKQSSVDKLMQIFTKVIKENERLKILVVEEAGGQSSIKLFRNANFPIANVDVILWPFKMQALETKIEKLLMD